jgi:hypothetical protein
VVQQKIARYKKNPVKDWEILSGAKRIRTADPLHAIQEFDGPRLIASTGMTLK